MTSVFNLVSTVLGGGVLSMPYAFSKSGYALGTAILLTLGILSAFGLILLKKSRHICVQRGYSVKNYEDLSFVAFGPRAQQLTTVILFLLTFLVGTAYLILITDQMDPVGKVLCGEHCILRNRSVVQIAVSFLVFPVCLLRTLRSLRFTSVLGVFCVVYVTGSIMFRSIQFTQERKVADSVHIESVKLGGSVFLSVSLMAVSYVCHFNFLPVYRELKDQSSANVNKIVFFTLAIAFTLYECTGLFGYLRFGAGVSDDILKDFPSDDTLIIIGRVSVALTLMSTFPLNVNPCRAALDRLLFPHGHVAAPTKLPVVSTKSMLDIPPDQIPTSPGDVLQRERAGSWSAAPVEFAESPRNSLFFLFIYTAETFAIVSLALFMALVIPKVSLVWSFYGATVSILIVFIFPPVLYVRLRYKYGESETERESDASESALANDRLVIVCAYLLAGLGFILMILCTMEAVDNLHH